MKHVVKVKSGSTFGKREATAFYKKLFERGQRVNIPNEEGVFLEKAGSGSAWVLTNKGMGGKITVPIETLKSLNAPVLEEKQ